jgi:diaminohydroxyphosphoribosylaminopyrimidine deaminase/5-amino-6-(5-phosphoribosylamino)uracil reductase
MRAPGERFSRAEEDHMRRALALAERGYGGTSPNPMVGAVLVRDGKIIAEGWHKRAGEGHAEINALKSLKSGDARGASLFVTLEPCSTFGRTPPCTDAIIQSGIKKVIAAATDPNPKHAGEGFEILQKAGIKVRKGLLEAQANRLNEAFNFWVTAKRPWIVCKCAMSLDGKIATNSGESKWITGGKARQFGMRLRLGADAIVAGVNTVIRDDPALTLRVGPGVKVPSWKKLTRVVLDPQGRVPENARVLRDENAALTTIILGSKASRERVTALERLARVWVAPFAGDEREIDLRWVLKKLGAEEVTSVLVEGGGETHARFFRQGLVNRVYFFYAPLIIAGRAAPKGVAGEPTLRRGKGLKLSAVEWGKVGPDLLCSALVEG